MRVPSGNRYHEAGVAKAVRFGAEWWRPRVRPVQCPLGSATSIPCAAGRFSASDSLVTADECELCPLGHACSLGASAPELCAAGRYGAARGQTTRQCAGPCIPGHFCVEGSTSNVSGVCRKRQDAFDVLVLGPVHPALC